MRPMEQTGIPDAACGGWGNARVYTDDAAKGRLESTTYGGGIVKMWYSFRTDGCKIWPNWGADCSTAHGPLVSIKIDWEGYFQPSWANRNWVQYGCNMTLCLGPIKGFGACWSDYMRVTVYPSRYQVYEPWGVTAW